MDVLEIDELLVEMARQQQRGIVLFALGHLERALAELHGEVGGAERNRDHERDAAQDEPLNRAEPEPGQHTADRSAQAFRHDALR